MDPHAPPVDAPTRLLLSTWSLTAELAPYLLLGFVVAGILHRWIRPSLIQRHLGRPGPGSIIKAALFGVPLPLCSCGVIPVAVSLRRQGASRGAVASFTASTPQTGADNILATSGLLGPAFAALLTASAFIGGLVSGMLVHGFGRRDEAPAATQNADSTVDSTPAPTWAESLRHAFLTLPGSIAGALAFGLVLAGVLTTFLPADFLEQHLHGPWAYLAVTLVSVPLYICSTGSIPLAYALVAVGLSPGAALVLLIMGPATNTTTLTALTQLLGLRETMLYLGGLLTVAWSLGGLVDWLGLRLPLVEASQGAAACHETLTLGTHLWAGALVLLLLVAYARRQRD